MIRPLLHWPQHDRQLSATFVHDIQIGDRTTHLIFEATPLQRQEQAQRSRDKDGGPRGIELLQLRARSDLGGGSVGILEEKENDSDRDGSEGKITAKRPALGRATGLGGCACSGVNQHVEAPPPRNGAGEGAAEDRANNGCEAKDGAEYALVLRSVVQRDGVDNDSDL